MSFEASKSIERGIRARLRMAYQGPKPNMPGTSTIFYGLCTGQGTEESSGWRTSHAHWMGGIVDSDGRCEWLEDGGRSRQQMSMVIKRRYRFLTVTSMPRE